MALFAREPGHAARLPDLNLYLFDFRTGDLILLNITRLRVSTMDKKDEVILEVFSDYV